MTTQHPENNRTVGSYYEFSANPAPSRPPLAGAIDADVCVIGAGFTGLSSALHLAELGYSVVVLEGEMVGFGASGRNGGQIVNGYSRDMDVIKARYGQQAADSLGGMSLEGGDIIRRFIKDYNIQCDYKPNNVFAAFTQKQLNGLLEVRKNWQQYGHTGLEVLSKSDLKQHVNSDAYIGGVVDTRGGHIHPLNLCLGEAAAIESLGGTIYEHTRVTRIDYQAAKPVVYTANGQVTAKYVVACGNAYLGDAVPELTNKIMPVSTQVITTEVLGADKCKELMPSQTCVEDANYMLDYYRMTADNRLLYGGGTVYGGAEPANIMAKIRPHLEKTFPSLRGVKFDFAWSGNFALTLTRIPHFGRLSNHVYFAHGYSGHGVTCTHLAGKLVADALHGDATRFDSFATLPYIPFPGGRLLRVPLTVMGAWWYGLRDKLGM
jgi:gamma-glutamylputrescine oxidase